MENVKNKSKSELIWEEAEKGKAYQESMGFRKNFPEIIRFKEGDQWPAPTKETRNFPRPVFNMTEMFIRNKRAATTNQTLTISYTPLEVNEENMKSAREGADKYGDYSKVVWENIDQDELNNEFVDDALTLGTGALHYFWDKKAHGGNTLEYMGELKGEIIDILNIYFANPRIRNVQKQEYIIIETRMNVKEARTLAKENGANDLELELIKPDDYKDVYDNDYKVQKDDDVTVLIKYYKKDGVVYYSKSTRSVMLIDEQELTPVVSEELADEEGIIGEGQEEIVVDNEQQETAVKTAKITIYPIVLLTYRRRKKCIYGIGEAQDIIPVNKLYNQLKGMIALHVIRNGNPNILAKPGALKQKLTNGSGQTIIDYYMGGGDGIKYMQPPNFSGEYSKIAAEIFEMSRIITGNTEVSSGEALGANMAASAIIALQNQAKTPIKEFQSRYFSAMKEVGDIFCQFYKTYYSTTRLMSVEKNGKMETRAFKGTDYANIDFKTKVEVTSSAEKESLTMSILENMKAAGDITKEQYVELAPESAMPQKAKIKEMWGNENKQKELLMQAMEQIKHYRELLGEKTENPMQGGMLSEMQTVSNGNVNR